MARRSSLAGYDAAGAGEGTRDVPECRGLGVSGWLGLGPAAPALVQLLSIAVHGIA